MKISADVICRVCKGVFCCEKCRQKHEIKNHAIVVQNPTQLSDQQDSSKAIYLFCSICAKQPLTLKAHMYEEMLEHINANHLPLHCIKCDKLYTKIADLKEFSKCSVTSSASQEQKCVLNQNSNKDNAKSGLTNTVTQVTISTQTSPVRENDFDVVGHTPMSMLQLRWRTQSKIAQSEFISDSVSSIKNISNISNSSIRRSIGVGPQVRGKLVRSTSTPVNAEFAVAKPKDPTFNSSGEHVSSIYASGCDVESPAVQNPTGGTPSKQALDHKNRYRKSNRTKLPAVTPLRQVMSKSIQKAMVEHGLCIPNSGNNLADAPLDLRLSPAMRRTQSDISDLGRRSSLLHKAQLNREHLSQKLTEQIVITKTKHLTSVESVTDSNAELAIKSNSTSNSSAQSSIDSASTTSTNSVYQTCHSVEIITSTELSEVNIQKESCNGGAEAIDFIKPLKDFPKTLEHNFDTITPITRKQKVLKKIIQFETPQIEAELDKDINSSSNSEVFYTPTSTPLRKSSIRSNTKNSDCAEVYNEAVPLNLSAKLSPRKQRPLIDDSAQIPTHNHTESFNEDDNDNVFLQDNKNCTEKNKGPVTNATTGAGRLWSLMSSVIRLPSFSGKRELSDDDDNNNNKHSLLKRCASIAGSLVRPKPLVDEEHLQSLKRKRTYTLDNQYQLDMGNTITSPCADGSSVSSKRFRIYGRKPIDRMRVN